MSVKRERLRAATEGRPVGVDRQLNAIMGYVVAQEGPFKSEGRGEFDAKSLRQIVKLMKTTPRGTPRKLGVKSHFAHPTLSDDGIGKFLGRVRRPYIDKITTDETAEDGTFKELEVVRGDLYFDKTALEEPVGGGKPLGAYVMDLAESDPDALSSSLVLSVEQEYRLDGKGHHAVDENGRELPPLWRPTAIYGSDLVDEGDAVDGLLSAQLNIDGLPDAALRRGCELLDKHFPEKSREFIRERCAAWLERYLTRRFGAEHSPLEAGRRLRRFEITPELFVSMSSGTFSVLSDGLPKDASVVGSGFDNGRGVFMIMVQSEAFDPVGPGAVVPLSNGPMITRIDLGTAVDFRPKPYNPSRDPAKLILKRRVEGWKR